MPPAWRYLFELDGSQPCAELAAYGVNAHIANDLPQSAQRVGIPLSFRDDFFRVDAILDATAPEIVPAYVSGNRVLQLGATMLSTAVVKGLRKRAWHTIVRLRNASERGEPGAFAEAVNRIEREALRTTRLIAAAGSLTVLTTASLDLAKHLRHRPS